MQGYTKGGCDTCCAIRAVAADCGSFFLEFGNLWSWRLVHQRLCMLSIPLYGILWTLYEFERSCEATLLRSPVEFERMLRIQTRLRFVVAVMRNVGAVG